MSMRRHLLNEQNYGALLNQAKMCTNKHFSI